jgi:hypothetical protein
MTLLANKMGSKEFGLSKTVNQHYNVDSKVLNSNHSVNVTALDLRFSPNL